MPLTEMLKRHEGLRLKPYHCTAGKLTIGYGRNLEDRGITKEEAEYLLKNDVRSITEGLYRMFPDWFQNLDQVRQDVLIDMAYNLGFFGLSTFKNTLTYIANGDYEKAADNMLKSKWATQVKGRAEELSEMMRTGLYKE